MTTFPVPNYIRDSARTETEMKDAFENWLAATKQVPGGAPRVTYTISSGSITPAVGAFTVDTEAAAATDDLTNIVQTNLPDGWVIFLRIATGSRVVVVKNAAGGAGQITLAKSADFTLTTGDTTLALQREGTLWNEVGRWYGGASAAHRTFYATPGFGQNAFTGRQEESRGANIASAATLTPGTDGNFFHVTGTTGITAIASMQPGVRIDLAFDSVLTLTHNATSLILAGAQNYTTTPGDTLAFRSEGSGNWRQVAAPTRPVATTFRFHEDFQTPLDNFGQTPWVTRFPSGVWTLVGTNISLLANARGILRIGQNAAIAGPWRTGLGDASTPLAVPSLLCVVKASDSPVLTIRVAATASAGQTKWAGACDAGLGGGLDPVNGIYLRWSTTTYFAVCRSANSETVLNTGITANTTPRTFKFAITPTAVVVSEAGVTLGTISATIPTADLALCAAVGNTTDAADLDFFDVEFTR